MKRYILTFVVLSVLCCSYLNAASEPRSCYITSIKNLSQNHVKTIIQDSKGFMWFGTRNGLNRFDGKEVKIYNCVDKERGIGNNNVSALAEDKNKRIWVGTDRGIYIYDPMSEQFRLFNLATKTGVLITDWVAQIVEDHQKRIWIVIPNQGVFVYDIDEHQLKHYPFIISGNQTDKHPQCITVLKSGEIWVGTIKDGLYRYNNLTNQFDQFVVDRNGVSIKNDMLYSICEYGDYIVLGVHEGELKKYDRNTNTFSVVNSPDVHHKIIRHVQTFDNNLWVATNHGVYIIDEIAGKTEVIRNDPMIESSLTDNRTYYMYQDIEKGIWVGTTFGGVNYIPTQTLTIERYIPGLYNKSIGGRIVRDLKEDSQGNIWVCTEDNGISIFDPRTQAFEYLSPSGGSSFVPQAIIENQGDLWVGLFTNGIDIYSADTKTLRRHLSPEFLQLDESSIWALHQDKKGNIWLGNGWGVYSSSKNTLDFVRHDEFGYNFIFDIYEDSHGFIWVCTMGNGVYKKNPETKVIEHYEYKRNDPHSISSNSVSSITEDSKGNLWFSTDRGGICKYIKATNSFKTYSLQEGLPDDVAYKIVEDGNGVLWFGTNHGLVRFNPDTEAIQVFTEKDGIINNQFNYKSAIKTRSGKLYFGCIGGLIALNPIQVDKQDLFSPLYITKFLLFNEEVQIGKENSPLTNNIIYTTDINLAHHQNSIGFEFASLSYSASSNYKYAYKLEGFDRDWNISADGRSVSYTNLEPGTYTFRVLATNSLGKWGEHERTVNIRIKAPWWKSAAATYLYVVLLLAMFFALVYFYDRSQKKRYRQKQILADSQREKDIYNAKIEFFTDIAHEIRTPLILINGPLEAILEEEEVTPPVRKNILVMEQNVKRLLDLITQLLDFRKIDERKFVLNFQEVSLNELVINTVNRFLPMFEQKGKEFKLHLSEDTLIINADSESVIKIMSNLLNNALKYSKEYVQIELYAAEDNIARVRVINDGTPIPENLSKKIFEPFYRTTKESNIPGSGIGLSLANNLAKLNNAELILDTAAQLTTFILSAPIIRRLKEDVESVEDYVFGKTVEIEHSVSVLPDNQDDEEEEIIEEDVKENTILVVEDEPDVLSYLKDRLERFYNVYTANNGQEALDVLSKQYINLILSDMIMPVMDGLDLCQQIKSNEDTAQIPFILLTAKTDMDSKLKSLEIGADAYIEKPAAFNYLHKHINMLLKNREKEKKSFLNKPFFPVQKLKVSKSDEKFLNHIIGIIQNDLTNPELNVQNLADKLYMSRSGLHRKVKQITSLSPIEFIKLIRLKKAAELIQMGDYQIAEVCFMVGINSPSYFSKMFLQQFGMTPKEFAKNSKAGIVMDEKKISKE